MNKKRILKLIIHQVGGIVSIGKYLILPIAILFLLGPRGAQGDRVEVKGNSMLPSFRDLELLSVSLVNSSTELKRGDIVVFKSEITIIEGNSVDYVKRIIAVPEDEIQIKDGSVFINNQLLSEPYVYSPNSTFSKNFPKDGQKLIVPKDSYFVMGDNRESSKDSRDFGFVSREDINSFLPN